MERDGGFEKKKVEIVTDYEKRVKEQSKFWLSVFQKVRY